MTTQENGRLTALELAEQARKIAAEPTAEKALELIVQLALDSLDCEYASITLVHANGELETVASSHPVVDQADVLQYALGEGPCLTAAVAEGLYVIPETATDSRWPKWGPRAAELGLHSILSVHLFTARLVLGALNLYARDSYQYSEADIETARIVAAHASVALARARNERDLWGAIDSRHLIGQAQGVLIERYTLDEKRAFAILKRYSQQHNIKLHDVAAILLRTGELPGTESPSESLSQS
jgi:GAF domain-containing protein